MRGWRGPAPLGAALGESRWHRDDTASPLALWGSPLIDGGEVRQTISAGLAGSSYTLRCLATLSSGRLLALAATLPVRTA